VTSLDALVAAVDFARVGRSAARFSEEELGHLSARTLHAMSHAAVRARLSDDPGDAFWLAVRGNLTTLADTGMWAEVVRGPIEPKIEEPAFLGDAAKALPSEPWSEQTWRAWTTALSVASGRKGRALYHPLRLALTARENGPEMTRLLPLIGRAKAVARLAGKVA